jgi:NAD(P)-dependent dehydrogenase (short-subunit alcohol dehydrogenase family)
VSASTERVAVVTGAGRGIGREIARQLIARGYLVLVTDIDVGTAGSTAEELGERAWAIALDARDPAAHRAAAEAAAERGRLEVWVNNAGVVRTDKAWEHTDEEVRLIVESNLLGVMWGSRTAVEAMRREGATGGHIINIASMSAFGPVPGLGTYGATKHGVLAYTTSLQGDLDEAGIRIRAHAVCPDVVGTDMVFDHADEPDAAILFSAPRLYTPREVAERTVALLDKKKIVLTIPPSRAWLARTSAPFPRFGLKVLSLMRRYGERSQRRGRLRRPGAVE